jgi:hypothetical protein
MRIDMIDSRAAARGALDGVFSENRGRLQVQRMIHEAAADVEEGLEFWKTIAGNIPPRHRVSREFLNRQG